MAENYRAVIDKARDEVAPYRHDLDAGKWVSGAANILNVERLATVAEELLAANDVLRRKLDAIRDLAAAGTVNHTTADAATSKFWEGYEHLQDLVLQIIESPEEDA